MKDFSLAVSRLLREVRTDERVVDPHLAAAWCENHARGQDAHPVSGMPLHFGARGAPAAFSRMEWLFSGSGGSRLLWVRDRVDPVHHVWGRHACVFGIRKFPNESDPFNLPEVYFSYSLLDFLENAFLQEAELGFLQARANPELQIESATWGRLGPLWSIRSSPDSFRNFFESHPDSMLLHIPLETVLSGEGPCVCDDPFLRELESGFERRFELANLRRNAGYRVVRERRLVFAGSRRSLQDFRKSFPALNPELLPTGET